jgi:hypothetical protein
MEGSLKTLATSHESIPEDSNLDTRFEVLVAVSIKDECAVPIMWIQQ